MDYKTVPALVLLVGCICILQIQASFRQPQCRGKETKLTEEELKTMTECVTEFGAKSGKMSEIPHASMGCVGKCILKRQGMVDDKGVPMKENVFKLVNETMEPDVAMQADERVGKCIDDNSSGIDMTEDGCHSYAPMVECIAKAFIEVCSSNSTRRR